MNWKIEIWVHEWSIKVWTIVNLFHKNMILRISICTSKELRTPQFWPVIIKLKKKMTIHCIDWIFFFTQCQWPLNFIQVFSVQCHLTLWGAWEEVQVSNEKPYIITYIHTPGTDRWPSNAGSDFYISACLLFIECNWESDHHYTHFTRLLP